MPERVLVGVVDSGWPPSWQSRVELARSFVRREGGAGARDGGGETGETGEAAADAQDRIGHGTRVLQAMAALAPEARFAVAQVFGDALRTDGATVAQAIDWLVDRQVALINLSLGVRRDHAPLRAACERAAARGCLVLAATPALGEPVFPAAYPGVLRVMGDARCAPGQHSALLQPHVDFGACVLPPDGERAHAGASLGCAHLSGRVAALLGAGVARERAAVWQALVQGAAFRGPQRRSP